MPSEGTVPKKDVIKVLALAGVVAVVIVAAIFPSFFSGLFSDLSDGSFFQNKEPAPFIPEPIVQTSNLIACPYECCNVDENFAEKTCVSPQICELNECVTDDMEGIKNLGTAPADVIAGHGNTGGSGIRVTDDSGIYNCPFDCCEDEVFDEKLCPINKVCVNNACVNQEEN